MKQQKNLKELYNFVFSATVKMEHLCFTKTYFNAKYFLNGTCHNFFFLINFEK